MPCRLHCCILSILCLGKIVISHRWDLDRVRWLFIRLHLFRRAQLNWRVVLNFARIEKLLVVEVVSARRLDILLDRICKIRQFLLHQLYFALQFNFRSLCFDRCNAARGLPALNQTDGSWFLAFAFNTLSETATSILTGWLLHFCWLAFEELFRFGNRTCDHHPALSLSEDRLHSWHHWLLGSAGEWWQGTLVVFWGWFLGQLDRYLFRLWPDNFPLGRFWSHFRTEAHHNSEVG